MEKKVRRIVYGIMMTLMVTISTACGSSELVANTEEDKPKVQVEESADTNETEVEEEESTPEEAEETTGEDSEKPARSYADVGSTSKFVSDDSEGELIVTIDSVGIEFVPGDASLGYKGYYIPYAETTVENQTSEDTTVGTNAFVSIYADDYQYTNSSGDALLQVSEKFTEGSSQINSGRKGRVTFYSWIDQETADSANDIEMEIIDTSLTVSIKQDGQWKYTFGEQNVSGNGGNDVIYGVYTMSPNIHGSYNEIEIGFYTDEEYPGDYIYIKAYDENGEFCNDYSGYSETGGNPGVFCDKYEVEFQVIYTGDGVEVKGLTDDTYDGYNEEFEGYYKLDHAFNLNEVG